MTIAYHTQNSAHDLTPSRSGPGVQRSSMSILDTGVDLDPQQIEARPVLCQACAVRLIEEDFQRLRSDVEDV